MTINKIRHFILDHIKAFLIIDFLVSTAIYCLAITHLFAIVSPLNALTTSIGCAIGLLLGIMDYIVTKRKYANAGVL